MTTGKYTVTTGRGKITRVPSSRSPIYWSSISKKLALMLPARFDTSHCLMNNNGQLSPYDSGDYSRSCKGCTINGSHSEFVINCTCLLSGVKVTASTYDLKSSGIMTAIWVASAILGISPRGGLSSLDIPER
ncbi:hypothetical protein F5Y10DRAFT_259832 [Nemania abortiva]|nr:hypothetical protein F5Y10DRAFT_259832 [Nemania abortiva]